MMRRPGVVLGGLALALGLTLLPAGAGEEPRPPKVVRIGTIGSLFRDVPDSIGKAVTQPFAQLMEAQTGYVGQVLTIPTVDELGQQLADNQVQLGVFHGFEFAWARQKHPNLQPLVIAINKQRHLRACLVVQKDSEIAGIADLKSKTVALPRRSREHSRLFLERGCQACGQDDAMPFTQVTTPANIEVALDEVVDGVVHATVVDGVALEAYKHVKPGRFAKLKVANQSEVFPAAVVAYRLGTLDAPTLKRFRDGILNASKVPLGRQLMLMWQLTAFEPIPEDYDKTLLNIARVYPPPGK